VDAATAKQTSAISHATRLLSRAPHLKNKPSNRRLIAMPNNSSQVAA
jgi:hypothetical protein